VGACCTIVPTFAPTGLADVPGTVPHLSEVAKGAGAQLRFAPRPARGDSRRVVFPDACRALMPDASPAHSGWPQAIGYPVGDAAHRRHASVAKQQWHPRRPSAPVLLESSTGGGDSGIPAGSGSRRGALPGPSTWSPRVSSPSRRRDTLRMRADVCAWRGSSRAGPPVLKTNGPLRDKSCLL
jgi:hypothetical protein